MDERDRAEIELNLPGMDAVYRARERSGSVTRVTPLLDDVRLDAALGARVRVKAEHMQRTGSFKFRGLYNRVACLEDAQRARGLVTMSSGNAAQALALAAKLFDCPCTVVTFPDTAPTKLSSVRALGAEIVFGGDSADELLATSMALVEQRGLQFVHPFDDPDVIAGHASMALEMLEAGGGFDAVLVPTSGGGLLSATALVCKHLAPDTRIVGVQPADACGIYQSFMQGHIVSHEPRTIADGLRAQRPGERNFALIQRYVDDILLVDDAHILPAMALVWNTLRTAIEPSAAVGIALLMTDRRFRGMNVGVVTTGCNVDPSLLVSACQEFED